MRSLMSRLVVQKHVRQDLYKGYGMLYDSGIILALAPQGELSPTL